MKYFAIAAALLLSACASYDTELAAHLEAEQDFHVHQQYLQDLSERKVYRPEVYAEPEFFADCEYYQMDECYEIMKRGELVHLFLQFAPCHLL